VHHRDLLHKNSSRIDWEDFHTREKIDRDATKVLTTAEKLATEAKELLQEVKELSQKATSEKSRSPARSRE